MKKGFTVVEILIVIGIIALLFLVFLVTFNPRIQIGKGQDAVRKNDLSTLKKEFEEYFNDHGCYPTSAQVCYNLPSGNTCSICGRESSSPTFSPYLDKLPCDPVSNTAYQYSYEVDSNSCPQWYKIYTKFAAQNDKSISEMGCSSGCGPTGGPYNYSYGVTSPNVDLGHNPGPPSCSNYGILYVRDQNNACNTCTAPTGSAPNQMPCDCTNQTCYTDPTCQQTCQP